MNLIKLFKKKPSVLMTDESKLPDYEQAMLKSIRTEPDAWDIARHGHMVKCRHTTKGVTVLVNYPVQDRCGITDLEFSPRFSEIFSDFAVTKLVKMEAQRTASARDYTISLIRKNLGL